MSNKNPISSPQKKVHRDSSISSVPSNDDKTIPFLRRLTDMLQENDGVISFYPGDRSKGNTSLGRIVVHDRARVQSDVLPRYFNHASFASLRRQLNYFAFTRIGKGRQRGATYCNEAVVELQDILRLKRRVVGSPAASTQTPATPRSKETQNLLEFEKGPQEERSVAPLPVHDHSAAMPISTIENSIDRICAPSSNFDKHVSIATSSDGDDVKIEIETKAIHQQLHPVRTNKIQTSKRSRKILDSIVPVIHLPRKRMREYHSDDKLTNISSMMDVMDVGVPEIPKQEPEFPSLLTGQKDSSALVPPSPPPLHENFNINEEADMEDCSDREATGIHFTKESNTKHWNEAFILSLSLGKIQGQSNFPLKPTSDDVVAGTTALLSLGCQPPKPCNHIMPA